MPNLTSLDVFLRLKGFEKRLIQLYVKRYFITKRDLKYISFFFNGSGIFGLMNLNMIKAKVTELLISIVCQVLKSKTQTCFVMH